MRILITGGTGFVGKNIINNLQYKKYEIFLVQRNKKKIKKTKNFISCDLREKKKLFSVINKIKPHTIIHLAWFGIPNFNKANCQENLKISKNLIDAAVKNQFCKKLIITGTCKEYESHYGSCKESIKIKPKSELAKTKFEIFKYMKKKLDKNNKVDWYWLRIFYIYGFFQRSESLIPYCLKNIKNKKKIILKNEIHCNDYINIKFLSRAFKNMINKKIKSGIYNFGSGKLKSNSEIRNICLKVYKRKELKVEKNNRLKFIFANMIKFKKNFGWKPKENIFLEIKKLKTYYG